MGVGVAKGMPPHLREKNGNVVKYGLFKDRKS